MEITKENQHEISKLLELKADGRAIIAHLPYAGLSEKVQLHIAEWLKLMVSQEYNVISNVAELRELLRKTNPNITFYQYEAFNIRTEKKEMVKKFYLHDTADYGISRQLGHNLGELYNKTMFNKITAEA